MTTMSVAPILMLRRAIVAHLRADAGVTATSIGARFYGERAPAQPTWPFGRYGMSDATPGADIAAPLHIFSKDPFTDDVNSVAEAVAASLDGKVLALADGSKAYLTWSGTRTVAGEDEWQAIVTIAARVPRNCG
jgi:hypothetical protein